jgi:disulfide bond formation protein DsbB
MKISSSLVSKAVLLISVLALALALAAQYGFDLRPCNLCLIQRVPFAVAAVLAALSLSLPRHWSLLIRLAGLVLLLNGGIAFYHVGVEQHWWASAVCPAAQGGPVSVADIMAEMSKPAEVQCDTPAWSFHGVTMAALNVPFSLGLGLLVFVLGRKRA